MANWLEIEQQMNKQMTTSGGNGVDIVRREKLKKLSEVTTRSLLLYGVEMFNPQKINATRGDISIDLTDKDGFVEALRDIQGDDIDIIVHSPGGSPEATESIVNLLRSRFNSIRFIVPSVAKSAATMLCMSGEEIILGDNAELGPTDPQMIINGAANPAHAILKQFDLAKLEISKNNTVLPAWLPILQQYGPSLIVVCQNAIKLTKSLVSTWLGKYMFKGQRNAKQKAAIVSRYLAGNKHLSHSRSINIDELKRKGVKIKYAKEVSPEFTEALQDVYFALMQTFQRTGAYKIYENHLGKGFYKAIQVVVVQGPPPQAAPQMQP